jgi:hypothetical protein
MKETFDKIVTWVKGNLGIAIAAAAGIIVMLFFPKLLGIGKRTRRRRRYVPLRVVRRRRSAIRRSPPRRSVRRQYTKGGKAKKAWQIKGSLAARRHMAQIRRKRRA